MTRHGNLFDDPGLPGAQERVVELAGVPAGHIVRIVSTGQATPAGEWYDQPTHEFVALLAGGAQLEFEDTGDVHSLGPGDWCWIEAHRRHRVAWTSRAPAAVWLAVHLSRQ